MKKTLLFLPMLALATLLFSCTNEAGDNGNTDDSTATATDTSAANTAMAEATVPPGLAAQILNPDDGSFHGFLPGGFTSQQVRDTHAQLTPTEDSTMAELELEYESEVNGYPLSYTYKFNEDDQLTALVIIVHLPGEADSKQVFKEYEQLLSAVYGAPDPETSDEDDYTWMIPREDHSELNINVYSWDWGSAENPDWVVYYEAELY